MGLPRSKKSSSLTSKPMPWRRIMMLSSWMSPWYSPRAWIGAMPLASDVQHVQRLERAEPLPRLAGEELAELLAFDQLADDDR